MKAKEIELGGKYVAKVSGKLTIVQVENIETNWEGHVRYKVTNLRTGRKITFRSSQKFRSSAFAAGVEA